MLTARLVYAHANMVPSPLAAVAPTVLWSSEDGITICFGTTVPTDGTAGYAPGCIFHLIGATVGLYLNDGSVTSSAFTKNLVGDVTGNVTGNVTGSISGGTVAGSTIIASVGIQATAVARTATADGTGDAVIPANASVVVITSADATYQVKLPAAVVGTRMVLITGATGCELIATGSSVKINDVICSATNEAALPADSHFVVTCVSATEWILEHVTALGAVGTAIVPDALA